MNKQKKSSPFLFSHILLKKKMLQSITTQFSSVEHYKIMKI